jgi:hypothetical protein
VRFWIRELLGWLFVGLGLLIFALAGWLLYRHYLLEAGPFAFIGFVTFRGGIHLLKVAVAARVCLQAQERQSRAAPKRALPGKNAERPIHSLFSGRPEGDR